MKAYAFALTIFALGIGPNAARAETAALGAGTFTCASFAKHLAADPTAEDTFFVWAQGFLSGINAGYLGTSNQSADLDSKSPREQERVVRQYCATHPQKLYM